MRMRNQNKKNHLRFCFILLCVFLFRLLLAQGSGKLLSMLTSCTGCLTILVDILDRFLMNLRLLTRLAQARIHMLLLLDWKEAELSDLFFWTNFLENLL